MMPREPVQVQISPSDFHYAKRTFTVACINAGPSEQVWKQNTDVHQDTTGGFHYAKRKGPVT